MNPRTDCEVVPEPHAEEQRVDRGLTSVDMVRMVREGNWEAKPEKVYDIEYGKWTIRVKVGRCLIGVLTVMPDR